MGVLRFRIIASRPALYPRPSILRKRFQSPSKFWRNRHRRESVSLILREYEGQPLVDFRMFETGPDGIDRPTSKGLALSIKRLPALADAFAAANREAHRLGLFGAMRVSS